jgi:hypothetical protein
MGGVASLSTRLIAGEESRSLLPRAEAVVAMTTFKAEGGWQLPAGEILIGKATSGKRFLCGPETGIRPSR